MSDLLLEDIYFQYPYSPKPQVDHFNMYVEHGECAAILGSSGCGKTTLLRIVAGLNKPRSGRITLGDKELFSERVFVPPESRNIGMVFQDYALFPHMSVEKNIEFGLMMLGKKDKKIRVDEVLDLVEMKGSRGAYPHELSGGQQQRVALARALAPRPELLLLDEPFSNLNSELRASLRAEVKKILRDAETTALLVTHDQSEAKILADQIVKLENC